MNESLILQARNVQKDYKVRTRSGWGKVNFSAISDINLEVAAGETVCIVGESGCGKSTLARVLANLSPASQGKVLFHGQSIDALSGVDRKAMRKSVQFIFQDPYASLNPRLTLGQIIAEPLENFTHMSRTEQKERVALTLERVGLNAADANRRPKELSGGQRQRVGIARAIIADPEVIIADEAVSALDVSVKSQILNLLSDLQRERGMAYVFITHDVSVVRSIADRLVVMYLGRVMETGSAEEILARPRHPYTRMLLSAVPVPDPSQPMAMEVSHDEIPSALNPPQGCVFRTRCRLADEACKTRPPITIDAQGVATSCHHLDRVSEHVPAHQLQAPKHVVPVASNNLK